MKATLQNLYQKRLFFFFILTFFFSVYIYSQYFTNIDYGDEFDNFANTWLILKGFILYKNFFSNHLPALMILGIPAELIQHSKIAYRIEVLILYFSFFYISFQYLNKYLKLSIIPFMLFSSYAIALYGGQQFADGTVWAIILLSAFFIVAKNLGKTLSKKETVMFTALLIVTILSSPVHALGFVFLTIFHLLSQKKQRDLIKKNIINLKVLLITLIIPLSILILYLILTKSLVSFYSAIIDYNSNYYYYHIYPNPYIKFHLVDYYLHTLRDVYNHLWEIFKFQGPYLIGFLRSLKSIFFHPSLIFDSNYQKIIFSMFYENFLTFEVLILIFYLLGFIALFKKNRSLAIFSLLFILGIRVRINERIHMAPYYLFSYWMLSVAIAVTFEQIQKRTKTVLNLIFLVGIISITLVFIAKNNDDFRQTAYNKYTPSFEKTTAILQKVDKNQKILVIAPNMAAYFWVSGHLPFGYFINYYDFFEQSPTLKQTWQNDLVNYQGSYLIVGREFWENYYIKKKSGWLDESLEYVKNNYDLQGYPETKDFIFRRKSLSI